MLPNPCAQTLPAHTCVAQPVNFQSTNFDCEQELVIVWGDAGSVDRDGQQGLHCAEERRSMSAWRSGQPAHVNWPVCASCGFGNAGMGLCCQRADLTVLPN